MVMTDFFGWATVIGDPLWYVITQSFHVFSNITKGRWPRPCEWECPMHFTNKLTETDIVTHIHVRFDIFSIAFIIMYILRACVSHVTLGKPPLMLIIFCFQRRWAIICATEVLSFLQTCHCEVWQDIRFDLDSGFHLHDSHHDLVMIWIVIIAFIEMRW